MAANFADELTVRRLQAINGLRCRRWHNPDTDAWTGADWSNAMCGEAGETANVVKKLRRHETGTATGIDPPQTKLLEDLSAEIADTILYALLLADHYGVDVATALIFKFNAVSRRQGFPERLP